ncbi:MAG: restriction endonuclease [Bacteroidales bacterium]|nr:restriction endonuclease [Bacteroidales bacterium]
MFSITAFFVILSIAVIAILMLSVKKIKQNEEIQPHPPQEEPAWKKHNREFWERMKNNSKTNKEPDPEMVAKMAALRERKAQKKIEREQTAEQARLEKIRKDEEEKRLREEYERKYKEEEEKRTQAFKKLGLVEINGTDNKDDPEDEVTGYLHAYVADENLNFDKLLTVINNYQLVQDPIRVEVRASSGKSMTFWLNHEGKYGAIKEDERNIKRYFSLKPIKDSVVCFCNNEQLKTRNEFLSVLLADGVNNAKALNSKAKEIDTFFTDILHSSDYHGIFSNQATVQCENEIALIEYELPSRDDLSWVKEYKYVQRDNTIKETMLPEATIIKMYENLIYSICLRSIYELCVSKRADEIKSVVFNGFVSAINKANGLKERRCILSLQVAKEKFMQVDLTNVDPKICFKALKGVSAARLIDISPVQPVLTFNKNDRRFIQGKDVQMNSGTNLASMDWEDFEHLVRELFEMEFASNGGEVRVTQASRDGGVDAIVFDPDPLRGGKIVIQAKRYTNTVGVSAVRDLYGTVINEGANTGILITTSDYGHDSYEFAKDKPIKLLNGGHLLALLHKNGKEGYINIQEAKNNLSLT